jgi:Flp pilus assembly protein TadG
MNERILPQGKAAQRPAPSRAATRTMILLKGIGGRDEGGAAVEFALVLPVLLMLTFGAIEFGRMLWTQSMLAHAAAEGARYAMVRGAGSPEEATEATIAEHLKEQMTRLNSPEFEILVDWTPDNRRGDTVTVTLIHDYDFAVGGFLPLPVGPIQLTGSASTLISR